MAETTSYRKRVAKPRWQAARAPVTKQQPDDDSPSKRQCLKDINESALLTKTEEKRSKISSTEIDLTGLKPGYHGGEYNKLASWRNQFASERSRDLSEDTETKNRVLVKVSPLTPTRPAPRPPFSRNALPYASLPVAPPKPPRTYDQSPGSPLYPRLSPTLGDQNDSAANQETVVPVPAPRGRTKKEPVLQKETKVFASNDAKIGDISPVAIQKLEKRKNVGTKENFPVNSVDLLEEPAKKPVSARLKEWQRKLDDNNKRVTGVHKMANERHNFQAERLSSAPESSAVSAPRPAPRSAAKSDSSGRLFCDAVGEIRDKSNDSTVVASVSKVYEEVEEPFSVIQNGSKEQFYARQKDVVDSKDTKTPQKKRNAPLPPSASASNKEETKSKNRLYPNITDARSSSTHLYYVLEEPKLGQCHPLQQPDSFSRIEALLQNPMGCSESYEPADKRLDPENLASLTDFIPDVFASVQGNFRNDLRANDVLREGKGYGRVGAVDDDDYDDENVYCEIESPDTAGGRRDEMEAATQGFASEKSSCPNAKSAVLQMQHSKNHRGAIRTQRPVTCTESEHPMRNLTPEKPEKPKALAPALTPTSPCKHRVWPKKLTTPNITISHQVRSGDGQDEADGVDSLPFIPDPFVKQQLQMLQDFVCQELSVIHQTSNALAQCCHDLSAFSGSAEALECHRIILMACKKREAYLMEMQRLREGCSSSNNDAGPRGILTVSNIRLPIKPEFMSKIGTTFDTSVHHFVVLIRHGCNVVFTRMLSTHDAMVRSSLDFPDTFEIKDIRQNSFTLGVEVYGMSVERTPGVCSSRKKKALNPKKVLTPSCARRPLSPGRLGSVRTSNFINIASLRLDSSHLSKVNFSLERIPFSSPLQGSVHVEFSCQMESQIEERGFLTMFENRCGFGTWYRRWCVLRGNRLLYWKYPGEENEKEPIGLVDLKQCVTDKVDLVSRSYCARPNTFELLISKTPQLKQNDRSVADEGCDASSSFAKLWFSSDTKEERLNWCSQLNKALVNLRTWHNDAAKPEKTGTLNR